jgi:hypothetical protein
MLLSPSATFSRDSAGTLVDAWLVLTQKTFFPCRWRILIFLHSNLNQAQFKAQEEERQKREAEEKETQLEKKREEKRLKKMVSSVFGQSPVCGGLWFVIFVALPTFPATNLSGILFIFYPSYCVKNYSFFRFYIIHDFFQVSLPCSFYCPAQG